MPIGKKSAGSNPMVTLFFNLNWRDCPKWDANNFHAWKQEMQQKWPDAAHLIDQIKDYKQLYMAKFHQHTLPMPYAKKIVFIGDSAHAAAPQLGLGVNLSLIDALVLPRELGKANDLDEAFKNYAKSRFKHVVFYQTLARIFTPFYQSNNHSAITLREHLYGLVSKLFMMRKITAYLISGQLFLPLKWVINQERKLQTKKNILD